MAYRRWRNSSLPTTARFEMSEVFLDLGESVLPGDSALGERDTKRVVIQPGHAGTHAERQPAGSIKAAGQFNLHVPFAFAGPEWEARQGLLIQLKSHADSMGLSAATLPRIFGMATAED